MGSAAELVEGWPMETYPDRHPVSNKPVSNWWKMAVQQPGNGFVKVEEFNGNSKRFERIITSLDGAPTDNEESVGLTKTDRILGTDIMRAEKYFGGKPSIVQMGLWFHWNGTEWIETDKNKTASPLYYIDVTDQYYDDWRKLAYEPNTRAIDPFKGVRRPYTVAIQQKMDAEAKDKRILELESKLATEKARIKP